MRKILVTGGCGLIARHLVKYLLSLGKQVTVVDNSHSAIALSGMSTRDNLIVYNHDILDFAGLCEIMEGHDTVFHLAAQVSVPFSVNHPYEDAMTNIIGTLNVLEAALRTKAVVVFTSSAAVYGNMNNRKIMEDFYTEPISPYGISKLAAERYCLEYSKKGLKVTVLRLSNVVGLNKGVVYNFVENALFGKPMMIYGDGMQTRDFVNISDVVEALYLASQKGYGQVYNIGSGKSSSIIGIANRVKNKIKVADIEFVQSREGDIRNSGFNISKATKELGYVPKYDIEKTLNELFSSRNIKGKGGDEVGKSEKKPCGLSA
jgi:UDP-glucose 4-epimerase